jgi:SAM-dependent methyltransferase
MLETALGSLAPRLIVDCGAGTGRNLDWLAELGPAIGIEQSAVGLAYGHAHGRRMLRGSVTHLPFQDACAEVVTSFDVLTCLDDLAERQAIREMWRILAFDGVLVINVAALRMLHRSHSVLVHEQRRYTRRMLGERLEDAGFTIERITYTNLPVVPLALAQRLTERYTGATEQDLNVPPGAINSMLNGLLAAEHAWLHLANVPIGSSVLVVARKRRT